MYTSIQVNPLEMHYIHDWFHKRILYQSIKTNASSCHQSSCTINLKQQIDRKLLTLQKFLICQQNVRVITSDFHDQ